MIECTEINLHARAAADDSARIAAWPVLTIRPEQPTLDPASARPGAFQVGERLVDGRSGMVISPTGQYRLRAKELALLRYLHAHADMTFTRDQLLALVWNCEPGVLTRTVDQTVATLRKKIETEPRQPRFLQTVYGIGYRLIL